MRRFEHLSGHILVFAAVTLAITAAVVICATGNLP
jgi:hypothetical protein